MPEVPWIPLFPLGVVFLPGSSLPLHIFEERYKTIIGECMEKKEVFGVVHYKRKMNASPTLEARCAKLIERLKLTLQFRRIIGGNGHPPSVLENMS